MHTSFLCYFLIIRVQDHGCVIQLYRCITVPYDIQAGFLLTTSHFSLSLIESLYETSNILSCSSHRSFPAIISIRKRFNPFAFYAHHLIDTLLLRSAQSPEILADITKIYTYTEVLRLHLQSHYISKAPFFSCLRGYHGSLSQKIGFEKNHTSLSVFGRSNTS